MATAAGAATNPVTPHPRTTADSPAGIANLSNCYFALVFTSRGFHVDKTSEPADDPIITELKLYRISKFKENTFSSCKHARLNLAQSCILSEISNKF
jgi:hypothetical protein